MSRRGIGPGGETVIWKEVEIEAAEGEEWAEYELEDGSVVRIKPVLASIERAEDDEGNVVTDDEGNPVYNSNVELSFSVSEVGHDVRDRLGEQSSDGGR